MEIARLCFEFVADFPKSQQFGLAIQITRSATSIPSNIAEGCGRNTQKDMGRFIDIALGSAFELETQLIISQSINFGNNELRERIFQLVVIEQKMIRSFRISLQNRIETKGSQGFQ